jgi:hypothetical protein
MAKAAPTKLKKDTPKTKTPNEKKYEKYGYKEKIVKAESSSYDATKGELTKTFSDADVKKYGIKKTSTTKAKIKSPAKKTIDPPKRKKTTTVENFNYGDQFSSTVKTKQKNKKNGEVKVKQKSTSKNYNPATGKRTAKSVSKAKAKLETYDENVSSDPSEGTVKKSNIVSLKKSYKTKGSPKVKGKVTGSGSKSGAQSVTGKGLDKSLDNVNTIDVRRNLKSPASMKSPVKMDSCASEMPSEATGGSNPKRAMRKAKRRGNRGGREAMKKFRKCKRSRYGRGKAN